MGSGGGAGHAGSCRPPPGRGRGACPACSARARPVRPGRCPRGPGGRCGTLGGPGPVLLALPARAAGAGGLRGPQGLAAPPAATQSNVGLRGRAGLPAGPEAAPAGSAGRGGKAPAGPGARGPRRSFPAAAADREHHGSPPGRPLRGEQSGCLGAHPGPGQRGRPGTATPESCRWDEVGPCPPLSRRRLPPQRPRAAPGPRQPLAREPPRSAQGPPRSPPALLAPLPPQPAAKPLHLWLGARGTGLQYCRTQLYLCTAQPGTRPSACSSNRSWSHSSFQAQGCKVQGRGRGSDQPPKLASAPAAAARCRMLSQGPSFSLRQRLEEPQKTRAFEIHAGIGRGVL
ncbi:collagen alpha-1(I) chain-like [Falco biarmicus]|uniref:collagen alpha-1(I) chain-like n=1 Tax=Falco biarmicus TaxID=345155 RepID=UPI0024BC721B|nr:collagen alpha-1(I) chain-like [Falco biarmicus]